MEHVSEEINEFVGNMLITFFEYKQTNSVMCGYFCIAFIDFMLAGKKMTDFTNFFSPHDFQKNDKMMM